VQWLVALVLLAGVGLVVWRARREVPHRVLTLFVVGAIVWTGYALTRPQGLFSGDEGVKLAQTFAVADGQLALTYPGETVDPDRRAFPFYPPFVIKHEKQHYGIYSPSFTVPSMVGWRVFGWWGLYIAPLLGGLVALWFTLRLALRIFDSPNWVLATGVALLATPLVLNATVFNEHAPATGLVMFAAATASEAVTPRAWRLVASGFALGLAATIRLELVAILPAFAAFVALSASSLRDLLRRFAWIGVGGTAAVTAYVIPHLLALGELSPSLHPEYLRTVNKKGADVIAPAKLKELTGVGINTMVWPFLLSLVPVRHRVLVALKALATFVFVGILMYGSYRYLKLAADEPKRLIGHIFIATPLCIIALSHGPAPRGADPRHRIASAIWSFALAGTAAIWILNPVDGGLRLGDRYTLPMIPLWVLAGVAAVYRSRLLRILAVPALVLGVWAVVLMHERAQTIRSRNATVLSEVQRLGDRFVVSELFWGSQLVAPLWNDHVLLASPGVNARVLRAVRATGATGMTDVAGGLQYHKAMLVLDPPTALPLVRRYHFVDAP
jgi:hypothetical protein